MSEKSLESFMKGDMPIQSSTLRNHNLRNFMLQPVSVKPILYFTAWYEKKHNVKLGADPAELTKLVAAFKTLQDALSL